MVQALVEGIARVVAVDSGTVWLEPEQTATCGGCASAAGCAAKSGYTSFNLAARRFSLVNDFHGRVGERVVIGIAENSLVRASVTAYGIPLATLIGGALIGQQTGGGDAAAGLGAVLGLVIGLLLARLRAGRLAARGELTPKYLRHAIGLADHGDSE